MDINYKLPFKNPNEGFNTALLNDYIIPLSKWFVGASSEGVFLKNTNSSWEAAMAMRYLIAVDTVLPDDKKILFDFGDACINQAKNTLKWLVKNAVVTKEKDIFIMKKNLKQDDEGNYILYCWDQNTWDTSVIVSSIIKAINKYGNEIFDVNDQYFKDVICGAVVWLIDEFDDKRKEYSKYCFGATDFAPVLSMLVLLLESNHTKALFRHFDSKKVNQMAKDLANYLLLEKEEQELHDDDRGARVVANHWGDNFITAEVANALASYFKFKQKKTDKKEISKKEIEKLYVTLKHTGHWFEISQTADGMWGAHDDTIHSLQAYIVVEAAIEEYEIEEKLSTAFEREEHKIFKAIRWLLDEKQRARDGSYLHTSYLTVFFAEMLINVYVLWPFSREKSNGGIKDKTVYLLYDEVFWMSPVRSATERTKNIQLEIEKDKLNKRLQKAKEVGKVLAVICAFLGGSIAVVAVSLLVGAISIPATGITVIDERLFGIIDVVTMILTVVLTYFVIQKIGGDNEK